MPDALSPIWHPFTQHAVAPPPTLIARGEGARLITPDGIGPDFMRVLVEEHELLSENASPLGDIVTPVSFSDDWYIATDITAMLLLPSRRNIFGYYMLSAAEKTV